MHGATVKKKTFLNVKSWKVRVFKVCSAMVTNLCVGWSKWCVCSLCVYCSL